MPAAAFAAPKGPVTARLADWKKVPELQPFAEALAHLEGPALRRLPAGRHPIDGDRLFANIVRDATRDPSTAEFEAHRKYADIHFLVSGSEMIGYVPIEGLKVTKEYREADDIAFYARPARFTRIVLEPGRLALFLPNQPHLPNCHAGRPDKLHKIVLKIRM